MSLSTLPLQHQKEKKLKKINSMNATVILSAVMAMATSVASVSNFAYNSEINNGKVESQTVYEVQNQQYLQPHLKYNYTYDEQNRLIQKEVLKWNKQAQKYDKDRCAKASGQQPYQVHRLSHKAHLLFFQKSVSSVPARMHP